MKFEKAVKNNRPVRLELQGVWNAGKTFTSLTLAKSLSGTGKTLVVDTETQRSSLYADLFDFDVVYLSDYKPGPLQEIVAEAVKQKYATLIVDSFSDFWIGTGGVYSISQGKFSGWKAGSEAQNTLMLSLLSAPIHLICTCRMKMEYLQKQEGGRQVVERLGLEPIQRNDAPHKFDWVIQLDQRHEGTLLKGPILGPNESLPLGIVGNEVANNMLDFLQGNGIPEVQKQPAQAEKKEVLL